MATRNGCSNTDSRSCEAWPALGHLMWSWISVAAMATISSPLHLKWLVASGSMSRRA